jgi:tetratricopeptide (TPR) repeat protein
MSVVEFFGSSASAQRAVNILLHFLSACFLFLGIHRLSGEMQARSQLSVSLFVAFVFLIHPLQLEPVLWVSSRKDVLAGLFWNLGFLFYTSKKPTTLPVYICFLLGLMSKATLITFPFLLLAFDFLFKRPQRLLTKLPMFIISFVYIAHTLGINDELSKGTEAHNISVIGKICNASWSLFLYVKHYLFPYQLSISYALFEANILQASCAILLLATLGTWALKNYRDGKPALAFSLLWFLICIAPFLKIKQIGIQGMADRYMYIPQIGLSLTLYFIGSSIIESLRGIKVACIVVSLAFLCLSVIQSKHWESPTAVFQQAAKISPDDSLTLLRLGNALAQSGKREQALINYQLSLEKDPFSYGTFSMLLKLARKDKDTSSIKPYLMPLSKRESLKPFEHVAYARMLTKLADFPEASGDYQRLYGRSPLLDARWHFQQISKTASSPLLLELYRAHLALALGEMDQAKLLYQESTNKYPRNSLSYLGLAAIAYRERNFDEARELSFRAYLLDPTSKLADKLYRLSDSAERE